jgi:hypothetical protein
MFVPYYEGNAERRDWWVIVSPRLFITGFVEYGQRVTDYDCFGAVKQARMGLLEATRWIETSFIDNMDVSPRKA